MNEKGQTYASLILYLLQNLSRPDTIQYVCLMTDDILSGKFIAVERKESKSSTKHLVFTLANDDNARYFHETSKEDASFPFAPFIKVLESDDEFMALEASKVLTILAWYVEFHFVFCIIFHHQQQQRSITVPLLHLLLLIFLFCSTGSQRN